MIRILHISDLHFGWPAVLEQVDAVEALARTEAFDVVAVSGDLAQRARAGEFQRAAVFLRDLRRPADPAAPVPALIVVPGNHDVAWWFAPLGLGSPRRLYEKYRRYISDTLEPVLRVPGATFVGLNTALGVDWGTLTTNPRDISIVGALRAAQLQWAADTFRQAPAGDVRIVVMHHNPMLGELSKRHGLMRSGQALDAFEAMGVQVVLCGHDHQEAVHYVERTGRAGQPGIVVSTAGTLSSRSRGERPSSFNIVTVGPDAIDLDTRVWSPAERRFVAGPRQCFAR